MTNNTWIPTCAEIMLHYNITSGHRRPGLPSPFSRGQALRGKDDWEALERAYFHRNNNHINSKLLDPGVADRRRGRARNLQCAESYEGRSTRQEVGAVEHALRWPLWTGWDRRGSRQARRRDGLGINERIQGADRT